MDWLTVVTLILASGEPNDWGLVGVVIGGCAGMGTLFMFSTRAIVRDEIAKLDTTYMRCDLAEEKFRQLENEMATLRRRLGRKNKNPE